MVAQVFRCSYPVNSSGRQSRAAEDATFWDARGDQCDGTTASPLLG